MNRDALSLVKEYARIQKSIQPKVDRMEEIKDSLSKLLPQGKSFSNVGDVILSENVTYPFAKSSLSDGQKNRVMKKSVDTKKWASLYPDDYASAKTLSESKPWKVTVSIH